MNMESRSEVLVLAIKSKMIRRILADGQVIIGGGTGGPRPMYVALFIDGAREYVLKALARVREADVEEGTGDLTLFFDEYAVPPFKIGISRRKEMVPVRELAFIDLFSPDLASRFLILEALASEAAHRTVYFVKVDPASRESLGLPEHIPLLEEDYRHFAGSQNGEIPVDGIVRAIKYLLAVDPRMENAQIFRDFAVKALMGVAVEHASAKKHNETLEMLHEAGLIDPGNFDIKFFMANVYFEKGLHLKSIEVYGEALKLSPGSRDCLNNIGLCHVAMENLPEAIKVWEKSLRLPGGSADVTLLVNLAKGKITLEKFTSAITLLKKALIIKPDNMYARNTLAVAYASIGKIRIAVKLWEDVAKAGVPDETVLLNLGRAYMALKEFYKAYRAFFNLIFDQDAKDNVIRRLATQSMKSLEPEMALLATGKSIETAKDLDELNLVSLAVYGVEILMTPRLTKAFRKNLARLLENLAKSRLGVTHIAIEWEETDRDFIFTPRDIGAFLEIESREGMKVIISTDPAALADLLISSGDEEESAEDDEADEDSEEEIDSSETLERLRKAVEDEPGNEWAHYQLGTAHVEAGNLEEGLKSFIETTRINPNNAIAHHATGAIHTRMGDLENAAKCFQRAIISSPDETLQRIYEQWNYKDSLAYFDLGDTYLKMEKVDEAIEMFKKGLANDAKVPLAHFQLGICLGIKGDFESAVGSFNNAILLDKNFGSAHTRLGIAFYQLGRYDEAVKAFKGALDLNEADLETLFVLAQVYVKKGDIPSAVKCLKAVVRLTPDSEMGHTAEARMKELLRGGVE